MIMFVTEPLLPSLLIYHPDYNFNVLDWLRDNIFYRESKVIGRVYNELREWFGIYDESLLQTVVLPTDNKEL
jgi:hypothetical protein